MPRKISTLLNVSSKDLDALGAFDGFIDIDSRLHVDPSLLVICKIPEFKNSYAKFMKYFADTMTIVNASSVVNDRFWREAHKRLQFKEISNTALGYSKHGTGGNAIGPQLANSILTTVSEFSKAGVNDPVIFELVGLLEEGIGADRISDMTIAILVDDFAQYTQRVSNELRIQTQTHTINGKNYALPTDVSNNSGILLIPTSLMNHLPIATDWDDIDRVCKYNDQLRQRVNSIIGDSWKAARKLGKTRLKQVLFDYPDLLRDLITQYKEKPRKAYDFKNDPLGELIWAEISEHAAIHYPLNLASYNPVTPENILIIVKNICDQFSSLIENNGWFEYLYDNTGKLKPERAPQLLFYGIAEVYCIANNLDLNRETNAGIGSLDFKISRGFNAKVNVELKYSTNPGLLRGFEKQLPAYNKAEKTDTSIYLIIQAKDNIDNINEVISLADSEKKKGKRVPEIMFIDGRKQVSASKRK
jgi:hypothetical protein